MRIRRQPKDEGPNAGDRRSVYEDRGKDGPADEGEWTEIGELDRAGHGQLDPSRIGGWVPLEEFLWRRR